MRTATLTIFIILGLHGQAQISISTGFSRVKDNLFGENNFKFFDKAQRNLYNTYNVQVDYTKSFFRVYSEVGYIPISFKYEKNYSHTSGGGSSPSYSEKRVYNSDVKSDYFTIKLGIGSNFKLDFDEKWWGVLSYNFYGQYDRLIRDTESNEVMYRTTSQYILMTGTSEVTEYPPDYYHSDFIQFDDNFFQFGMELKGRVGFNNYFIEISSSLGIADGLRSFSTLSFLGGDDSKGNSHWVLNAGLKVGYLFQNKNKKSEMK